MGILLLTLSLFSAAPRESWALNCIDITHTAFKSEEEALDWTVQNADMGKLFKPYMDRYNRQAMLYGQYQMIKAEKETKAAVKVMIDISNEMVQVFSRVYEHAGVPHVIKEHASTVGPGAKYIEIKMDQLPGKTEAFKRLSRVAERLNPRTFGEKSKWLGLWKTKKYDFPLTVEISPAVSMHGQSATWSEGGWRVSLIPHEHNLSVFLPGNRIYKASIYHEFSHGFFSKRRLLGKPSCIYDVQFNPAKGVRANGYTWYESGEEVYNAINTPFWGLRDIEPSKLTAQNLIEVHNDVVKGSGALNGAKENVELLVDGKGRLRGFEQSAIQPQFKGNQFEIFTQDIQHTQFFFDQDLAKSTVSGSGKNPKLLDATPIEQRLLGLKYIAEKATFDMPSVQKNIIAVERELSAGLIKPEEAHRKVMVILREYGMPSRQAIMSVPIPKPIQ